MTNGDLVEFISRKGYRTEKHWSPEGWEWREREDVEAPLSWELGKDGWERVRFGRREPVPMDEPVQHVSWYEADAYARSVGKRLPTEEEWERAAAWHERRGKTRFPWGREFMGYEANLGHRRFSPAPAGSYAGGESPSGLRPADRRRVGVDVVHLPRLPRASSPTRTPSTRRSSSARSTASSAAARGRPTRSPRARASATGTSRSAATSSRASAARETHSRSPAES